MKHTILLIDDEVSFVTALAERLELRGFAPTVAHDGPTGINALENGEFAVMVLDLRMPDMDGVEVLERLRERGRTVPTVILTGHGTQEDHDRCAELGCVAFFNKPVNIEVLASTLREAADSAAEDA